MFGRGTARGLLNYQEKIDKQREKLQEKIDARYEKLQTLLATRSASSSKAKTYTPSIIRLKNRLGNVEGSNIIYQAIANDPSSASRLLEKINKTDKEVNYEITPEQIVEFFPILQTGSPEQIEGYQSTGDIVEAMKGDLSDNELYFKLYRAASIPAPTTTGTTVFGDKFIAKSQPEKINAQTKEFNNTLMNLAMTELQRGDNSELNQAVQMAKDGIYGPLIKIYGPKALTSQNYGLPLMRDAMKTNPTISAIKNMLDSIPDDVKKVLRDNPTAQRKQLFDKEFGIGAADYILGTR